jgi:hypothetical protein
MASSKDIKRLVQFIRSNGITPSNSAPQSYNHMGATLSDAILQAGLNYNAVVKPRILRLLTCFPTATTTSHFMDLVDKFGADKLLNWNHPEKPARLIALTNFFYVRSIETESDLSAWLQTPNNAILIESIKGVGPKTVDYIKMLVGMPAIAVDRHLKTFVMSAGLKPTGYTAIRRVVEGAADTLRLNRTCLDYAIWLHVSTESTASLGRR